MKVAKNMDSVFADCTEDELEFDIIFDDEDTLIDLVAGVDEAGIPFTGEDFDFESLANLEEADDMVGENPDFEYQNDGDASGSEKDAEGTKVVKPEIGGEVGDGKEVSGKEDSAESHANDVKDEEEAIGCNDKQQAKLEAFQPNFKFSMEKRILVTPEGKEIDMFEQNKITDAIEEDAAEGPLEDDDQAEREGEVSDTAISTESSILDEVLAMLEADDAEEEVDAEEDTVEETCCKEEDDAEINADVADVDTPVDEETASDAEEVDAVEVDDVEEAVDTLLAALECDDTDAREGKCTGVDDTEGVDTEVLGKSIVGDVSCDPIADIDDESMRDGSAKRCDKDVEGEKTHVVGAALEAEDPLADPKCPNDSDVRDGATPEDAKEVEGVDTEIVGADSDKAIGAALEAEDNIDDLLAALDDDDDIEDIETVEVVPDDVQVSDDANEIEKDVENANEAVDAEELVADADDEDIQEIEDNELPEESDIEYEDSDDELIDAIINGLDLD